MRNNSSAIVYLEERKDLGGLECVIEKMAGIAKGIRMVVKQASFVRQYATRPCAAALHNRLSAAQEPSTTTTTTTIVNRQPNNSGILSLAKVRERAGRSDAQRTANLTFRLCNVVDRYS